MKRLLIIFYRNPELGNVKNRLAETVGEERALALYLLMVSHTRKISLSVIVDRVVYYSAFIDTEDNWEHQSFQKRLQLGDNLGEKMKFAFEESFNSGYESICIIGTDCLEITENILIMAFDALTQSDVVVGPAADGGYYLMGMNRFVPELFEDKNWGTDLVFEQTIKDIEQLKLSYQLLPMLHDIDYEADLPSHLR